jgi:hypothetical protein
MMKYYASIQRITPIPVKGEHTAAGRHAFQTFTCYDES